MNESKGKASSYAWKAAGWCVAAASLAYIGYKISQNPIGETIPALTTVSIGMIAVFIILYSLLNTLLGYIWARFALTASGGHWPGRLLVGIYLRSGIVKYLPGNIFHLAGRHVMAGRIGVGQGSVLAANIYEMVVISITAMLAVIVLLFTGGLNDTDAVIGFFRRDIGSTVIIAVIILALSSVAVIYCRKKSPAFLTVSMARMSLGALPAYLVFFVVSSLILTGLLGFYSDDVRPLLTFHTVLGVFSLSWIAGFLAPGAPGGLGVRETVIVLMLGSAVGEGPALGAALLLRAVTAAGDVLSFVYSFFLEKKEGR